MYTFVYNTILIGTLYIYAHLLVLPLLVRYDFILEGLRNIVGLIAQGVIFWSAATLQYMPKRLLYPTEGLHFLSAIADRIVHLRGDYLSYSAYCTAFV